MQEIGRPGRDGQQSCAYLLYHEQQLRHTRDTMRNYVLNMSVCRRAVLMSIFDAETTRCVPEHTCCDVCASTC